MSHAKSVRKQPSREVGTGVLESHAKRAPQATQRPGDALRVRGAASALSNRASTLLREQPRAIATALPLIGATGTSIVILTETLRQRGAAKVGA